MYISFKIINYNIKNIIYLALLLDTGTFSVSVVNSGDKGDIFTVNMITGLLFLYC
jgi:hypothetical protein